MERATVSISVPQKRKSPWGKTYQEWAKTYQEKKRSVTDRDAFKVLLYFFALCIGVPILIGLHLIVFDTMKKFVGRNESSANSTSTNLSVNVVYETFSATISALTYDDSFSHSFLCNVLIGLLSLLPVGIFSVYFWNTFFTSMTLEILSAVDFTYHYVIVSAGKMALTTIFLIVMYCQSTEALRPPNKCIKYFVMSELAILLYNVKLHLLPDNKFNSDDKNFTGTIRFYTSHRYLMLFQFLNLIAMLFVIVYAVINLYRFLPIYAYPFIMLMTYAVIVSMHYFGNMVLILARASRSWEPNEEVISLKIIFSSMITISRYHMGTIFSSLFGVQHLLRNYRIDNFAQRQVINYKNRLFIITNASCVMKHLMMFTAINGEDISEAAKNGRYFGDDNEIVLPDFKNRPSSVWGHMLFISLPVPILSILIEVSTTSAENVLAGIPILTYYAVAMITYFYVIVNTINTVENTIEFCQMVTSQDTEVLHKEKQSKKRKGLKVTIVSPTADKVKVLQYDEDAENEKEFEMPRFETMKSLKLNILTPTGDEGDDMQDNELSEDEKDF